MIFLCTNCSVELTEREAHWFDVCLYSDEARLRPFCDDCEPVTCGQCGKVAARAEQFLDLKDLYLCNDCAAEKEDYNIAHYTRT